MSTPSLSAAPRRTVTCVGFDWRAESSLRGSLGLLGGKTRERWEYGDDIHADVVIYHPGNPLAGALVRQAGGEPPRQLYFVGGGVDDGNADLPYPFSAIRLLRCLDHASSLLVAPRPLPAQSLAERLDEALRVPGLAGIELSVAGLSGFLSVAQRRLFWPHPFKIEDAARLLLGEVTLRSIPVSERDLLRRLQARCGDPCDSEPLLWSIAIATSGGRLLPHLDPSREYRLTRWPPDLGAFGQRGCDLHCAALIAGRAMSPSHLTLASGVPPHLVNGFINACALCGLLEGLPEARRERPSPPTHIGLARRLRSVLALPG